MFDIYGLNRAQAPGTTEWATVGVAQVGDPGPHPHRRSLMSDIYVEALKTTTLVSLLVQPLQTIPQSSKRF
jgi:hypothetical protein